MKIVSFAPDEERNCLFCCGKLRMLLQEVTNVIAGTWEVSECR